MAQWLRKSTEITRRIGPFIDKTNGVDEETGLAGAGTEISKAGGAFATGPTLGTHDAEGWYPITLTTSHTDTLGSLTIKVHDNTTHLPVWAEFLVVPATVFDAMVNGTDALDVNTIQLAGTAQTGRDIGASVLISYGTGTGELLTAGGIAYADLSTVNGNSIVDNGSGALSAVLVNNVVHGGLGATLVLGGFSMLGDGVVTGNTSVSGTATFGNMTITNTLAAGSMTNGGTPVSTVSVADIHTTQMTESYAADGTAPTIAQALFLIQQQLGDFAISGTTITVKKLDGTTTAATFTLDDGTTPTGVTRAT